MSQSSLHDALPLLKNKINTKQKSLTTTSDTNNQAEWNTFFLSYFNDFDNHSQKTVTYIKYTMYFAIGSITSLFITLTLQLSTLTGNIYGKQSYFNLHAQNIHCLTIFLSNLLLSCSIRFNQLFLYSLKRLTILFICGIIVTIGFVLTGISVLFEDSLVFHYFQTYQWLISTMLLIGISLVSSIGTTMLCTLATGLYPQLASTFYIGNAMINTTVSIISFISLIFFDPGIAVAISFSLSSILCLISSFLIHKLQTIPSVIHNCVLLRQHILAKPISSTLTTHRSTAFIYRKIWLDLTNMFLTLFVTYTLYPGIITDFTNFSTHQLNRAFTMILVIIFLLSDSLGRHMSSNTKIRAIYLWLLAIGRVSYIPVYRSFLIGTDNHEPWFNSACLLCVHITFGFSNGFLLTSAYDSAIHSIQHYPDIRKIQFFSGIYNLIGMLFGTLFMNLLTSKQFFSLV